MSPPYICQGVFQERCGIHVSNKEYGQIKAIAVYLESCWFTWNMQQMYFEEVSIYILDTLSYGNRNPWWSGF